MMCVKDSNHFSVYKIHVVDSYGEFNTLKSTFYDFESEKEMIAKWLELIKEDHWSIDMISQEICVASAFHL